MASGILVQVDTSCCAALGAVLCRLPGCLNMATGISSEVTWLPPPLPQWLTRSPWPPGPNRSAVIQAPGAQVGLSVQGMVGEDCWLHYCHWHPGVARVWQKMLRLPLQLSGHRARDRWSLVGLCPNFQASGPSPHIAPCEGVSGTEGAGVSGTGFLPGSKMVKRVLQVCRTLSGGLAL